MATTATTTTTTATATPESREIRTKFGFGAVVNKPLEPAIAAVTDALKAEGFGVLTTIDVTKTLKAKLGVDVPPRVILGACNPKIAHAAMQAEPDVSLFLPCNVVVEQRPDGGSCDVRIVDPAMMLGVMQSDALAPLGKDADERLHRVADALKKLE